MLHRQGEGERAPGANCAFDPNAPTMHLDESFGQCEPETRAFDRLTRTGLLELLEDPIVVLVSDAAARAADGDRRGVVQPSRTEDHPTAGRRELHRVREQIEE